VKTLRAVLLLFGLAALGSLSGACDDDPPAVAAEYVCPMHPERTGKAGDRCPDCNMALEPRAR
jgi:hypothetical protein